MILAGDVGGTKSNLGWFSVDGDGVRAERVERYRSADFDSLQDLLATFVAGPGGPWNRDGSGADAVCLGIAGPVVDGEVRTTNLPWTASEAALAERFAFPRVELVNDLVATAEGIPALPADATAPIVPGRDPAAPTPAAPVELVVAAGTGFGASLLVRDGPGRSSALPTEAGHVGFAPHSPEQLELAAELRRRHGRVTIERVVSGEGIVTQYEVLRRHPAGVEGPPQEEDEEFRRRWRSEDRSELISEYAATGRSPLARATMHNFLANFGAVTGDLALAFYALRGVWVAGGIAAGLEHELRSGGFGAAFVAKGRMRSLAERIPVRLVRDPEAPLRGAARRGARTAAAGGGRRRSRRTLGHGT